MEILRCLSQSKIVKFYIIESLKFFKSGFYIRLTCELENGDFLYIREYIDENVRNYSYHLEVKKENKIIRWDNAPYHKNIKTFPHHKHINDKVCENYSIECKAILKEIEEIIK